MVGINNLCPACNPIRPFGEGGCPHTLEQINAAYGKNPKNPGPFVEKSWSHDCPYEKRQLEIPAVVHQCDYCGAKRPFEPTPWPDNVPYPGLGENLKKGATEDVKLTVDRAQWVNNLVQRVRTKAVNDPVWAGIVVLGTVFLVHNLKDPIKKGLRGKRKFVKSIDFDGQFLTAEYNNKSFDQWNLD